MKTKPHPLAISLALGSVTLVVLLAARLPWEAKLFWLGPLLYLMPLFWLVVCGVSLAGRLTGIKVTFRQLLPFVIGTGVALVLVVVSARLVPPRARVQWDETNLYATSLSMHLKHSASIVTMSLPGENGPVPLARDLDKRPPLFPFLLGAVHEVQGPSPANAFLLNHLALFVLLFSVFARVYARFDVYSAIAAQFLLVSAPLLLWVANSGAMDLVSCAAVFALTFAAADFLERRTVGSYLHFLAFGGLACTSRYEVIVLFVPLFALCTGMIWRAERLSLRVQLAIAALPLAFTPLILLLLLGSTTFYEAGQHRLLSLESFFENAKLFVPNFYSISAKGSPFMGPVNLMGLVAIAFVTWRRKWSEDAVILAFLSIATLLIALAWFQGSPVNHISARLYLLPSAAASLAPLLFLRIFPQRFTSRILMAVSVAMFASSAARVSGATLFPESETVQFAEQMDRLFGSTAISRPKTLLVWDTPFFGVTRGWSSVSPAYFEENWELFCARQNSGVIGDILSVRSAETSPLPGAKEALAKLEKNFSWREIGRVERPVPVKLMRLARVEGDCGVIR